MRHLIWFSCGAASAVAAKIGIEKFPDAEVLYCDTSADEHPDNSRFMADVSLWIGREIKVLRNPKYRSIYDVFNRGYLVGVGGAACTNELKKKVRKVYQQEGDVHIFGFTLDEQARADTFELRNADIVEWILIDAGITKNDCYNIIRDAGIELPMMYKLGYNNNNCIGCVKGGAGYWNKIRIDFPDRFERMAKLERRLDVAINKRYEGETRIRVFLDELDPNQGRFDPLPSFDCGVLCERDQLKLF